MYKLILSIMLAVGCVMLSAQQMDELMAMHALFQAKNAANRAAHAAAQQVDRKRLSLGERWIDEARAPLLDFTCKKICSLMTRYSRFLNRFGNRKSNGWCSM